MTLNSVSSVEVFFVEGITWKTLRNENGNVRRYTK
jgi:hypothetical protein